MEQIERIEPILKAMAAAFVSRLTEPASMRATLKRNSMESQTFDAQGRPARLGGSLDVFETLRSILTDEGVVCLDVAAKGSREFVLSYTTDLPSLPPRVVFDTAYRYPGHPRPGMPKPEAAFDDGRPTDPEVLAEVQTLVAEFVRTSGHSFESGHGFESGYSEAEILAAEKRLGVRLPEDVRALYRTIHDDNKQSGILGLFCPAPLEKIISWYEEGDPGSYGWDDGLFEYDPVVFESAPFGHVKRLSRNDWWVTFAPDYGMNYAALDLDPGPAGNYGQVLMYGRDVHGPIVYVAPSIKHLMREAIRGTPHQRLPSRGHEWLVDVGKASLPSEIALLSGTGSPAPIQFVHLRQVQRVRLTDLAGLPHLRSIRILDVRQLAEEVDLTVAPGQPVEQVHIVASRFEPELLATAPSIRFVTLGGNVEPVRVAGLANLPELVRLDLSEAEVADIASIASFKALRVLILNVRQWDELLSNGHNPASLAAAGLGDGGGQAGGAGPAGLTDSVRWLNAVQRSEEPVRRLHTIQGRL